MSGHYDETALQDYLDDPDAYPGRVELEAHLAGCTECEVTLDELQAFESALTDETFDSPRELSADEMNRLRALADLMDREDAQAETLVGPYLASPAAFGGADVANPPQLRTAGVARRLSAESARLRERQPIQALALADAAIAIGEQLSTDTYPEVMVGDVRGAAWLERANALRYLGRNSEALDALEIAERWTSRSPVAAFATAPVVYTRAVIFLEIGRLADALLLARRAARVFRQFGEDPRYVHARSIEGAVLFDQSRYREARELFVSLLPLAGELDVPATLAGIFGNVANCELRLGNLDAANDSFERALSLYQTLGLETERIRAFWNIGCLRIARGDLAEGLSRLRQAKRDFESIGARSDAALVTLDIAEALLASGEAAAVREAADLCRELALSFTAFGNTANALTALGFLREALESGKVTAAVVRRVRETLVPQQMEP